MEFFRQASPYIVNHHGGTFVIVIPGTVMKQREVLEGIVQDVALLQSLGVRVVLVLGSSEQVDELSLVRGVTSEVVDGRGTEEGSCVLAVPKFFLRRPVSCPFLILILEIVSSLRLTTALLTYARREA